MKSLICDKPFNLNYIELAKPTLTSDQLLIKVCSIGICGTDIHAYTGSQPYFHYPRVLGHELCGTIAAIGDNAKATFNIGDKVALIPYVSCGHCPSCLSGKTNCCEHMSVIGVHQDGGFCEYLAVPKDNVLIVNEIDNHTAALIEPFAISAHGVRRAHLAKGEHVLVVGAGPIGLGAAAIAAADGAKVVVADTQMERRQHVQTHLSLPTLNPIAEDFTHQLQDYFSGSLAETVIDATGNVNAMNTDVNHIRHGGKIVFIGLFKGNFSISDPDFHQKETTLMGSRNATKEDFEKVLSLMEQGKLTANMMQTHTFDFNTIGFNYENLVINDKTLLKGVIDIQSH